MHGKLYLFFYFQFQELYIFAQSNCRLLSNWCQFLLIGVERYDHYDVLEDVDFKEGMKKFS